MVGRWPEFDNAMRHIVPDLPKEAVVIAVDPGDAQSVNVRLTAGVMTGDTVLEGSECERMVAREWLVEFIKTGNIPRNR